MKDANVCMLPASAFGYNEEFLALRLAFVDIEADVENDSKFIFE